MSSPQRRRKREPAAQPRGQDWKKAKAEIDALHRQHRGKPKRIIAERVFEFAKNPNTALHAYFPWDVEEAAMAHWMSIAHRLIARYEIEIVSRGEPRTIRKFVHIKSLGRGCVDVEDVLSDAEIRAEHVRDTLARLQRLRENYGHLTELDPIWNAIDKFEL